MKLQIQKKYVTTTKEKYLKLANLTFKIDKATIKKVQI